MSKYLVTAPLELSTFKDQPPELGALIVHDPIAYGSEAVPEPLVTHAQLRKSAFEVIVIAACGGGPAAGAPLVRIRARAASGITLRSRRERSILPPWLRRGTSAFVAGGARATSRIRERARPTLGPNRSETDSPSATRSAAKTR